MIEQALSATEWESLRIEAIDFHSVKVTLPYIAEMSGGIQKKIAAACLDGQEWGFTWEDVRRHRAQAAMMRESVERWGDLAGGTVIEESAALSAWHDSVADRLEALLRPEVVELYVKNEVSP